MDDPILSEDARAIIVMIPHRSLFEYLIGRRALANVPAITGMENSGRGSNGNGGAGASVYIHQIGASAQNSTLVIMDGHRLPVAGSGNGNPVVDPNIIPQNMLERVEVLADGASSVYGSDAVSGVVNFITRKKFDGLELRYQIQGEHGFLDLTVEGAAGTEEQVLGQLLGQG